MTNYLSIPTSATGLYFSSGTHFTLAAWVKLPNQVNGSAIISTGYGGGGEQYDLDVQANKFRIVTRPTIGGSAVAVSSAAALTQNAWHHVVAAWDGTTSNMTLYVNGQISATNTIIQQPNLGSVCVSTNPVTIGARLASSDPESYSLALKNAVVDEVRIYNRTLTANDVFELYAWNGRLPQITTVPRNVTNYAGDSALFSVAIDSLNSTLPVSYQWLSNGVAIADATNSNLVLTNVQVSWSGPYSISVSNVIGTTSRNVYLQVQSLPATNTTSDLVGYWKFDEASGLSAADSSPNANAGTLSGFSDPDSAWVLGQYNNALKFNADASTVNLVAVPDVGVAAPAVLDFFDNPVFTLAAWVKGTLPQSNGAGIICRGDGAGEQYALDLPTAGYRFYVRDTNGTMFSVATTIQPDGTWQHVAGVFDSANGIMSIYVNGQLANFAVPPSSVSSTTHELSIGNRQSGAGTAYNRPFTGSIDDVRVYHRALTSADVQGLYNSFGFDPYIVTQPSSLSRAFGQTASFSAVAGGTGPFSYQWYKNDAPLSNGGTISGATSATLDISSTGIADGGDYRVIVLGGTGSRISSATATLNLTMTPGQALYWDTNGAAAGSCGEFSGGDPSGLWGTDPFWSLDGNGAQATGGWIDGGTAVFSAGSDAWGTFTVTLSGPQTLAGLVFQEGSVTLSGSTLTFASTSGQSELNVAPYMSAVVGSAVAGTNALIKTGEGSLRFNGVNTYSNKTVLKEGIFAAAQDNRLGAAPGAFLADSLTFDGGTLEWVATGGQAVNAKRGVKITANGGTVNESGGGTITFNGTVSGPGHLTKSGSGTMVLTTANTFSGGLEVQGGMVQLNSTNIFTSAGWLSLAASTGIITLADGATIRNAMAFPSPVDPIIPASTVIITNNIVLTGSATLAPAGGGVQPHVNYAGVISGPGGIIRKNLGDKMMILSGTNTFSGGVQLVDRPTALGNRYALGTGTLTIGDPFIVPNGLRLEAAVSLIGPNSVTNPVTLYQQVSLCSAENMPYGLELSGPIELGNLNLPIYCNQSAGATLVPSLTNIFSGVISSAYGYGFTKQGGGTLVLKGANTYGGDTFVAQGTLAINNTTGSGCSNVTVTGASASLVGTGTIGGVAANSTGTISAGPGLNSVGKLTLQNGLDMSTGGTNSWDLNALKDDAIGVAGTDFDQLALTAGELNVSGASLAIVFSGTASAPDSANPFWQSAHTWTIITLAGTASNPGSLNFATVGNATNSAGFFSTVVAPEGSIRLTYTPTATPRPTIENVTATGESVTFSWNTASGFNYEVDYKTNLIQPNWLFLRNVSGTGGVVSVTDLHGADPARFYRVVVIVP